MSRPVLAPNAIAPEILESMSSFHPEVVKAVSDTVAKAPVVVVGMAGNPFVKKARKALTAAGVEYEYLEYGNYLGQWRQRLAIKLWSGFPTFPQVFVKGVLIGGATELKGAITDGSLQKRLANPNGKNGKSPIKKKTTDKK